MSQENDIVYHLRNIGPLTPLEALDKYRCFRLASRVSDLRHEGYNIETRMIERNGKRFAEYFIPQEATFTAVQCGKQEQYSFAV